MCTATWSRNCSRDRNPFMNRFAFLGLLAVFAGTAIAADEKPLPKVLLVGDSIRLGYAPLVAKKLAGKAMVISPMVNSQDSSSVLKNLDAWVIREKPALIHFNCGLHDLKLDRKTKAHQIELDQYESNLKRIVERLRKETGAIVVFALTTPVDEVRHAKRRGFDRFQADVERYNKT